MFRLYAVMLVGANSVIEASGLLPLISCDATNGIIAFEYDFAEESKSVRKQDLVFKLQKCWNVHYYFQNLVPQKVFPKEKSTIPLIAYQAKRVLRNYSTIYPNHCSFHSNSPKLRKKLHPEVQKPHTLSCDCYHCKFVADNQTFHLL